MLKHKSIQFSQLEARILADIESELIYDIYCKQTRGWIKVGNISIAAPWFGPTLMALEYFSEQFWLDIDLILDKLKSYWRILILMVGLCKFYFAFTHGYLAKQMSFPLS